MFPLVLSVLGVGALPADLADFAARMKASVVKLSVEDASGEEVGNGSGFFVSAGGRIVTNHHVIEHVGNGRMRALLADGRKIDILGVLADDEENDVAVVQAAGTGYAPLAMGDSTTLKVGEGVAVISSPRGYAGTLSEGIISAIRPAGAKLHPTDEDYTKAWKIQHTADVSPGSSGSPLMLRDGRVVGVVVGLVSGEHLNFAIPIEAARKLLDGLAPDARPKSLGPSVRRNLLISAAGLAVVLAAWFLISRAGQGGRRGKRPPPRVYS